MRNPPKRLFRARVRNGVLYVGPDGVKHGRGYTDQIERIARSGQFKRGHVYNLEVRHEDWCAIWDGRGCSCTPDIKTVHVGGSS